MNGFTRCGVSRLSLGAAFGVLAALPAAPSFGQVIIEENFEPDTPIEEGELSPSLNGTNADVFDPAIVDAGGDPSWVSSDQFRTNGEVTDGSGNFGSSALLSLGSYINDTKGQENGLFTLTADVRLAESGDEWITAGFYDSDEDNAFFRGNTGFGTLQFRPERIVYNQGGGETNDLSSNYGEGYTAGDLITAAVTLDLTASEYDGENQFGTVSFSNSQTDATGSYTFTEDVDWSFFALSELRGDGNAYENVTLQQVPEPGSLAVLGLGGLALLPRRRRS